MKLVVNSEGVYLTKVGECFCLKKKGKKQEIAAKKGRSNNNKYIHSIIY